MNNQPDYRMLYEESELRLQKEIELRKEAETEAFRYKTALNVILKELGK